MMHQLISADVDHLASEDDRRWFDAHPGAEVRDRPALPGELGGAVLAPLPGAERRVYVHQLGPGLRTRRPYWLVPEGWQN